MSAHISSSDSPLPAGRIESRKHEKNTIKEKCYGRNEFI